VGAGGDEELILQYIDRLSERRVKWMTRLL
jgi:hypothetical protein